MEVAQAAGPQSEAQQGLTYLTMANISPSGEPAQLSTTPIKFVDGQVHMNIRIKIQDIYNLV